MLGVVLLIISPAISIIQRGNAAPVALVERVELLNFICQSVNAVQCIDLSIFYGSRWDKDLFSSSFGKYSIMSHLLTWAVMILLFSRLGMRQAKKQAAL